MKILIYTYSLHHGGAERVASLWANGFVDQGHNVSVVLDSLFAPIKYKVTSEIPVFRLVSFSKKIQKIQCIVEKLWSRIPNCIKSYFFAKIIRVQEPDVIIVVMPELYEKISYALKLIDRKIPVVVTDHNAFERPVYAQLSTQSLNLKFVDSIKYDYFTVLTEADRYILEKKMDTNFMKKVCVLPNPLAFTPPNSISQKDKFVLAAGRLGAWHYKGFDLLLKAWAKVHKDFPDWILKIAGEGDQYFLRKMCYDLEITDCVVFLGFVDIKKQYEKAEIFVLSSRYEGFGMVLIEAMSQGCACIACDYKGRQREIITNETQGIICPPDDVESIVNALRKVMSDEDYRHCLQKNAIERSKYYELPNIMKRWNKIFERIGL